MSAAKQGPFRRASFLVLGSWCTLVLASALSSSDPALVRIGKRQRVAVPPEMLAELTAVQELESAWIAEAPQAAVSRLEQAGVSLDVLDTAPEGKIYFLVFTGDARDLDTLRQAGAVWQVDEGVCLLSARTENVREVLPPHLTLKRVGGPIAATITLQPPSTAGTAVRRRAVEAGYQPRPISAIFDMVNQVSRDRLASSIGALQAFQTRYGSTSNCESAGTYIHDSFRRLGLPTDSDYFSFGSSPQYTTSNVIATIPGKTAPERVVIISAHYDSYSNERMTLAPGADDNASGTAAVMELARVMAGYRFDYTVKFIAWGAEEWGLVGSRHYAAEARQRGERIIAALNLDMIGYADRLPEDLDLVFNSPSEWIATRFTAATQLYAPMPLIEVVQTTFGSDCSSFWEQSFSSLCGIEDTPVRNPYYHRTTDTLDSLDMDLVTAIVRATLATTADLAQPASTPDPPSGLAARSQVSRSLFARARSVYLTWDPVAGPIRGYNVYRTTSSRVGYARINPSPVTETSYTDKFLNAATSYYYVVTAIDESGRESSFSVEAASDQTTGR